jgi:hypothetical protein
MALPKPKSTTYFTAKMRRDEAHSGVAMRDGSFPIRNRQDLANARRAVGRAKPSKRPAVRAHIRERAKELGVGKATGKLSEMA